jgi:hypothetical protein
MLMSIRKGKFVVVFSCLALLICLHYHDILYHQDGIHVGSSLGFSHATLSSRRYNIIIADPISSSSLGHLGGISHWFHIFERLSPYFYSGLAASRCKYRDSDKLVILFREQETTSKLSPFVSFLLIATFSCPNTAYVIYGHIHSEEAAEVTLSLLRVTLQAMVILNNSVMIEKYDEAMTSIPAMCYYEPLNQTTLTHNDQRLSWQVKKKRKQWFQQAMAYEIFIVKINTICKISPLINQANAQTIVIYQRNVLRRLLQVDMLYAGITNLTALWNQQNHTQHWKVVLRTHDDAGDPCELIHQMNQATIFITPHGFQSMLLLFQPNPSALIELFPAYYSKPRLFGKVLSNLRNTSNGRRLYAHIDSSPTAIAFHIIKYFEILSEIQCLDNTLCRYWSRLQDIVVPWDQLARALSSLHHDLFVN